MSGAAEHAARRRAVGRVHPHAELLEERGRDPAHRDVFARAFTVGEFSFSGVRVTRVSVRVARSIL